MSACSEAHALGERKHAPEAREHEAPAALHVHSQRKYTRWRQQSAVPLSLSRLTVADSSSCPYASLRRSARWPSANLREPPSLARLQRELDELEGLVSAAEHAHKTACIMRNLAAVHCAAARRDVRRLNDLVFCYATSARTYLLARFASRGGRKRLLLCHQLSGLSSPLSRKAST